jgi:hypothetical protein
MEKKWDTVTPADLKRLFVSGKYMSRWSRKGKRVMWQCFQNGKKMEFLCSAAHCSSLPLHPVLTRIKLTAKKNEIEI